MGHGSEVMYVSRRAFKFKFLKKYRLYNKRRLYSNEFRGTWYISAKKYKKSSIVCNILRKYKISNTWNFKINCKLKIPRFLAPDAYIINIFYQ